MTKVFELPLIHLNVGIPPAKRIARKFGVSTTASFIFPEADGDELQPAMMFRYRSERDGKAQEHLTPVMQCRGMLVRPVSGLTNRFDDEPLGADGLTALSGMSARRMPKGLRTASASYYYEFGEIFDSSAVNPARVTKNGYQEAVAEIQHKIDSNFILIDGILYSRAPDPSWNFMFSGFADWHAEALLAPSASFTLPGDCANLVEEVRNWSSKELGREIAIKGDTSIEALSTSIPFAFNPILGSADYLAGRAELNVMNRDYFGPEVKALGQAYKDDRTVFNAIAFVTAYEQAATVPGAHEMGGGLPNQTWFDLFWKFYEVLPEGYKFDAGEDETLTIGF